MPKKLMFLLNLLLYTLICNCVFFLNGHYGWLVLLVPVALVINAVTGVYPVPSRGNA